MVKEMLVRESLTIEMIHSGKKLLGILDKKDIKITSAFWLYYPGNVRWVLIYAMPEADEKGPKHGYKKIAEIINNNQNLNLTLLDIKVLGDNDVFVMFFKHALKKYKNVSGIRFSGYTVDGVFVEDSYIYRMDH